MVLDEMENTVALLSVTDRWILRHRQWPFGEATHSSRTLEQIVSERTRPTRGPNINSLNINNLLDLVESKGRRVFMEKRRDVVMSPACVAECYTGASITMGNGMTKTTHETGSQSYDGQRAQHMGSDD